MEIIGHRGASGLTPENTLAAFRLAADLGAGAIETDLQLTRDGRVVLIHDATLRRTTNGRGQIRTKTFHELRQLDAGSWFPKRVLGNRRGSRRFAGEVIPTIEDLFALAKERTLFLYLEIKVPCAQGTEESVIAAINAAGMLSRCAVICFDLEVLRSMRKLDSHIALGYLFDKRLPDAIARAKEVRASVILPRVNRVTPKLISEAARHKLKVVTWTANTQKQIKKLIALGVDGIMSDFPDRLNSAIREK